MVHTPFLVDQPTGCESHSRRPGLLEHQYTNAQPEPEKLDAPLHIICGTAATDRRRGAAPVCNRHVLELPQRACVLFLLCFWGVSCLLSRLN